jgi:hypothetical protein
MQWKEKFLAFAIMVVLYYLVSNLIGQIILGNTASYTISYFAFVALGIISITISMFFIKIDAISSGIMFAGILMIITGGAGYYWQTPSQLEKTLILTVAFIILLGVGYFKFSKTTLAFVKKE